MGFVIYKPKQNSKGQALLQWSAIDFLDLAMHLSEEDLARSTVGAMWTHGDHYLASQSGLSLP